MKDRPVLGDVDVLSGEHGIAAPGDAGPLGESKEQAERLSKETERAIKRTRGQVERTVDKASDVVQSAVKSAQSLV